MKLINKLSILALLILSTSCGQILNDVLKKKNESRKNNTSNSIFSSYIEDFESTAKRVYGASSFSIGDIPVNFGDTTNDEFDGVCIEYSGGKKEVIVKESWWNSADSLQRKQMIFHELGHCRLGREHNSETIQTGAGETVKISIMNPVIPASYHYRRYQSGYDEELFTTDKTSLLLTAQ